MMCASKASDAARDDLRELHQILAVLDLLSGVSGMVARKKLEIQPSNALSLCYGRLSSGKTDSPGFKVSLKGKEGKVIVNDVCVCFKVSCSAMFHRRLSRNGLVSESNTIRTSNRLGLVE